MVRLERYATEEDTTQPEMVRLERCATEEDRRQPQMLLSGRNSKTSFYYFSLVQYHFKQHRDVKGVQKHRFVKRKVGQTGGVSWFGRKSGDFVPSTFYYFQLVQYYL